MNHPARTPGARSAFAALGALAMVVATAATGVAAPGGQGQGKGPGGTPPPVAAQSFELTILHINDGESALLPSQPNNE